MKFRVGRLSVFFIILISPLFFSCEIPWQNFRNYPCDRVFHAYESGPGGLHYCTVPANKILETEHLEIYIKDGQLMSEDAIEYIAVNFDAYYDTMISIYGTHTDVDNNGKIILLLFDITPGHIRGQSYTAGYFNPNDLYSGSFSNKGEILYAESQVSNSIKDIFVTVIHEFQHLINTNMNQVQNGKASEVWLNEALSCSAEISFLGGLQATRQDSYNDIYSVKTNYFYHWDGIIEDYATASVFMYWLYLHGDGDDIFHDIAHADDENRTNYKAIVEAISNPVYSYLNTLTSWEDILLKWLIDNENTTKGYPNGVYAYSDKTTYALELNSRVASNAGDYSLNPGDAVVTSVLTTGENANIERRVSNSKYFTLNKDTSIAGSSIKVELPVQANTLMMSAFSSINSEENYQPVDPDYNIIPSPLIEMQGQY